MVVVITCDKLPPSFDIAGDVRNSLGLERTPYLGNYLSP